jgi:hypothetical protein
LSRIIGENDYRVAGFERLQECKILLDEELFAGSAYLGGRAVESMLRAVIWNNDVDVKTGRKTLDTGHSLVDLLKEVSKLGLLTDVPLAVQLWAAVQSVGRHWFNNMRFVPTRKLKTIWWKLGEISGKRTLKEAAYDYYNACSTAVKGCEVLCQK